MNLLPATQTAARALTSGFTARFGERGLSFPGGKAALAWSRGFLRVRKPRPP